MNNERMTLREFVHTQKKRLSAFERMYQDAIRSSNWPKCFEYHEWVEQEYAAFEMALEANRREMEKNETQ